VAADQGLPASVVQCLIRNQIWVIALIAPLLVPLIAMAIATMGPIGPKLFLGLAAAYLLYIVVGYLAAAWLVVQVVETVLPVFGLPDVYIRWVVIGLAILFLPVLALSWSFEWSASGLERQSEIDSDNARRGPASRTFDRIVIAVLAFAVLFFAADKFLFPSMRGGLAGPTSIAVLPFADLTPTQDRAYFADGFAEELLDALSRNRALPGRSASAARTCRSARSRHGWASPTSWRAACAAPGNERNCRSAWFRPQRGSTSGRLPSIVR